MVLHVQDANCWGVVELPLAGFEAEDVVAVPAFLELRAGVLKPAYLILHIGGRPGAARFLP